MADSDDDTAGFKKFMKARKKRLEAYQELYPDATVESPGFKEYENAYLSSKQPRAPSAEQLSSGKAERQRAEDTLGAPSLAMKVRGAKASASGKKGKWEASRAKPQIRPTTAFDDPSAEDPPPASGSSSTKQINVYCVVSSSDILDADTARDLGMRGNCKNPFFSITPRGSSRVVTGRDLKTADRGLLNVRSNFDITYLFVPS